MFPYQKPPNHNPFTRPPFPHHSGPTNPFLTYFKTKDGHWDWNKISSSLNEANKFIGQVDPLVKQVSAFIKNKSI